MVIDAVQKFDERRWRNQLLNISNEFVDGCMDLNTYIEEMYFLGFDNILTQKYAQENNLGVKGSEIVSGC